MAQTLLTASDKYHERVRSCIDVGLGQNELENKVIDQDGFVGEAVREVKRVIPNAESLTDDSLERVKNAAIYYTAARLCHVVVRKTAMSSQTRGNHSVTIKSYNPKDKEATLRGWADQILSDLKVDLDAETRGDSKVRKKRPKIAVLAVGRRGR